MSTNFIDVEQRLGQYDPGVIFVGPLLSLSKNSRYRYFYIAGNGSKVYENISLGFIENETNAQTQRADFIEKLTSRFAEVLSYDSAVEMAHAVHARWPSVETARFLAFAGLEAKSEPTRETGRHESIDDDGNYAGVLPGDEVAREPVDRAKGTDDILRCAPSWARDERRSMPMLHPAPTLAPPNLPVASRSRPFSGDRAVTQRHSEFNQEDIASAVLTLKSSAELGDVPRFPVESARSLASVMLRFCAVGGTVALVAAIIAWAMVRPTTRQVVGEAAPAPVPVPLISVERNKEPSQSAAAPPPTLSNQLAEANKPVVQAEPEPAPAPATVTSSPPSQLSQVASVQAGTAPASGPQSLAAQRGSTARRLDAEEIAALINRGTDSLKSGDLASARLLLRRAAEAGSASAALLLGTTFDPLVIQQLGAIGVVPDVAQARQWYEKAAELGSDAASQRLAKLPQTGQ